jgi:hypothetical protein
MRLRFVKKARPNKTFGTIAIQSGAIASKRNFRYVGNAVAVTSVLVPKTAQAAGLQRSDRTTFSKPPRCEA